MRASKLVPNIERSQILNVVNDGKLSLNLQKAYLEYSEKRITKA